MPLYFTGRARTAALQILANTPLGHSLEDVTNDDGTLLSILPNDELLDVLSTGERSLYSLLASVGGHGCVNLYRLVNDVDESCAFHAAWAVGVLAGTFAPLPENVRA